jgi:dTDP-4-amino-4,6-dideoxygalactose transaminase
MTAIGAIAAQHDLVVIEDAAQAPLASFDGRNVGALFHLGGFSLNYHKHIHTGEGGMVVTDDPEFAQRCQLIRNHGENLAGALELDELTNVIGSNFRLTELQAAIGIVQLGRLEGIVARRRQLASHVASRLEGCPAVVIPAPVPGTEHSYYVYPMLYAEEALEIPRERFVEAVAAELPPARTADDIALHAGYVEPLYLNPLFQRRIAIGSRGFPFTAADRDADLYAPGRCPVAEDLHRSTLMYSTLVRDPLGVGDVDDLVDAIEKVVEHADELRG